MRRILLGLLLAYSLLPAAAQAVTVGACTGYTPVVRAGTQARVSPGASNRIRQTPGLTGTRVGEIPTGGVLSILYGPACADNLTWWLVRYQNQTGWTAEGEGETHWLQPNSGENHAPKQPPDTLGGTSTSVLYSIGLCPSSLDSALLDSLAGDVDTPQVDYLPFKLGEDSLRIEPGVCAPDYLAGEVLAFSPFGFEVAPDVEVFDGIGILRATLPDIAYTIPGVWTIAIRGYQLQIEIFAPDRPFMQNLGTDNGTYSLILGGFAPNERIVIVTSQTTADAVGYTPDSSEMVETFDPMLGIERLTLSPEAITDFRDMVLIEPETRPGFSTLIIPEITINPEIVTVLDGALTELEPAAVADISKLVFGQIDNVDLSVVGQLGMFDDSGTTSGIFGLTFQDFSGTEVQADASGFVFTTVFLDGNPLAAIGQTGSLAIWPNLAELYVPGGDDEALRALLHTSYWGDTDSQPAAPCTYTVASGDTLNRIARSYGITLEELLAANPHITNPDVIFRGLILTIPGCTQ